MFREIETDHVEYPFFQKTFPSFIRICEAARLGKNIPADVVFLAVGIAESLLSTLKLAGHIVADAGKLVFQPRRSYQDTKEFVS